MLTILSAPNQVLSETAKPVKKIEKETRLLIEEMKQTLLNTSDPEGIGLAAPQIGKPLQIFIVKPTPNAKEQIFINPRIVLPDNQALHENASDTPTGESPNQRQRKRKAPVRLEGCLSLPQIWGEVKRAPYVTVTYLDENGTPRRKKFQGFIATIIQHEYDHLQGILFSKRVLEQQGKLYRSKHNQKGEDVFKQIKI